MDLPRPDATPPGMSAPEDMELIQLVSFGCGVDAITGDEMRSILEGGRQASTQLKIDDISTWEPSDP